jgi:BatD DUF11 like domain
MKYVPLILLFVTRIAVAEVSVTLTAERTNITLEDQLEIQVALTGTRENTSPEILNAENFEIQSTGTSSQIQIINMQMSQQITFGFVLTPKNPGKFRVGPARVTVGGKQYESAPLEVTVGKSAPSQAGEDRFFYIVGEVDNPAPYVHQQINYTFKFFSRGELRNAQLGLPEFKGFLKEGPDKQREEEQVINGMRWHVTSLRFALFPMAPGPLQIEPAKLTADAVLRSRGGSPFEEFFGGARTKRVNLRSEPVQMMVNSLPSEGRPPSFSGLVGEFNFHASLGKETLSVGDSTTLTVSIEGNGDLRGFALPEMKSADFKLYDDQPTFDIKPNGNHWIGSKTFKRALVPLKAGDLPIPQLQAAYFDPKTKSYKPLSTQTFTVHATGQMTEDAHHVAPSPESSTKKSIEVVGNDLMPIKRAPSALRSDALGVHERWILLLLCSLCPLTYAAIFFVKRRQDRFSSDVGLSRKRKAYRAFNANLKGLQTDQGSLEETARLLRDYLGNKFNLDGKALTPMDASPKLSPFGLSSDLIKKVEDFLRDCEASQFGGLGQNDTSKHRERLVSLVQTIEKEARP